MRVAAKAIIILLKQIPILGAPIVIADDVNQEVQLMIDEQDTHEIEDRVKQLKEASECPPKVVKQLVSDVFAEIRQKENSDGLKNQLLSNKETLITKDRTSALSPSMMDAVADIMVAMPSNIKQKVSTTLRHAKQNGTNPRAVLPIASETNTPSEREQFYLSLIPRRRPKYKAGNEVPYKLGWTMEELLGIGGFGEVWKIREEETNMLQAIKLCLDPSYQELWKYEAKTITKLKEIGHHENIIDVLDLQLKQKPYWIVLEYMESGTLESYLRSFGGPMPLEKALLLFEQICQGMSDAHKLGIVHRDIKPGNILLTKEGIAKITDFGIGKIVANESCKENIKKQVNTLTLRGYGTLRYMSQEQQNLLEPDPSDDVYSLAMVLYDMLVGSNQETVQIFKSVLRRLPQKAPPELIEIMEKCLGEPRKYRIPNASELLKEIQKINISNIAEAKKRAEKTRLIEIKRQQEEEIAEIKKQTEQLEEEKRQIEEAKRQAELAKEEAKKQAELAKEEAKQLMKLEEEKQHQDEEKNCKTNDGISGFKFLQEASYSCGGTTNEVKEYCHEITGLEFVLIPGGTFSMGITDSESNENPIHKATLSPYLISKTEVIQKVWQKIMGNNPSHFKKGDNYPVECVSWEDCQEFCKKSGLQLPTETQWEYAYRAGMITKWYFGDNENELSNYAWYNSNSNNQTHPVAQKKPNGFGIYDMAGNVWEWCQDWYEENYYANSESIDPVGPNTGSHRIIRGGGWGSGASFCGASSRSRDIPSRQRHNLGFRVVFCLKS